MQLPPIAHFFRILEQLCGLIWNKERKNPENYFTFLYILTANLKKKVFDTKLFFRRKIFFGDGVLIKTGKEIKIYFAK